VRAVLLGFPAPLAPLVISLTDRGDSNVKQRLERTLEAHPYLKPRIEEILHSEDATLNELFQVLPGHRLDERAYLPRESNGHWVFAGWAVVGFFGLVGLVMAQRITPAWQLLLAGAFTATIGVAFLFLFQDFVGHSYELTLDPERHFLTNLLGFVFVVGLGEELAKTLPVIFYIRTFKRANWRGACLWGLASGIGFGVAEGILYSTHQYNGIAGLEIYLMRFISCVALHGLWSASVGITIFHSRKLVGKILGAVLYGGDWSWGELAVPLLRVLGIVMALHGLYDALLTQDMIPMALMVALVSFVWVGWQIESSREKEIAALAAAQPA
jgi:RsiW-degrading membrane proteinase PrsW (M82 family)